MNLFKATALILTIAVFNPVCCCLQLFAKEAPSETPPVQMDHSCCTADAEQRQSSQAKSHDAGNCPHQIEKSSLISQSVDHPDLQAKLTFNIETLDPIAELLVPHHEPTSLRLSKVTTEPPQSPRVTEDYCVRIL